MGRLLVGLRFLASSSLSLSRDVTLPSSHISSATRNAFKVDFITFFYTKWNAILSLVVFNNSQSASGALKQIKFNNFLQISLLSDRPDLIKFVARGTGVKSHSLAICRHLIL